VKRAHVLVSGRVQGVFFRATCAAEARARGLTGWVRNREDDRVEAVFEGEDAVVDGMIAWCRLGPGLAAVEDVSVTIEEVAGEPDFRVTR
jgi:acylphosphatase